MANLVLLTSLVIGVALLPILLLVWIDRIRGKRSTTSRATWWFAGIVVVWMILDSLGVLLPAYQAAVLTP
jgi:hypothetical protein